MRVAAILLGLLGAAAVAAWLLLGGLSALPSWLAAWLVLVSLPAGALLLVMGLELGGGARSAPAAALRPLLLLALPAGLAAIPLLLAPDRLFPWHAARLPGRAGEWFAAEGVVLRTALALVALLVFSLLFLRPPGGSAPDGRRGLAALGLAVQLVLGTLFAMDWVLSPEPGLNSSALGLLFAAAQCGLACSAALLLAVALGRGAPVPASFATLLLTLLGAWMFLHFTQFLIVWSANLPDEVAWYLRRSAGLGAAAEWLGFGAALLALPLLLRPLAVRPWAVAAVAALLLLAHGAELFWLVLPAFRDRLALQWSDGAALLGLCGVAACILLFAAGREGAHRARA